VGKLRSRESRHRSSRLPAAPVHDGTSEDPGTSAPRRIGITSELRVASLSPRIKTDQLLPNDPWPCPSRSTAAASMATTGFDLALPEW